MSQKQSIFMTGGSGYIGSRIIEFAIKDGYEVYSLSRSDSSDAKIRAVGGIPVRGDLESHDVLAREAAKADVVFNLADSMAGERLGKMSPEERVRINSAAVNALAEGLKGSGKPLVITSGSLMVAADPDGKETHEDSPKWETSPFGAGLEGNAFVLKDQSIRACSIRLAPYVYGRGGSGVRLFMQMSAGAGEAFYVDDGAVRVTTVHVDDAARLYLLAAQKGRAGEAYNATWETHVTQRQLAEAMGKALNLPVRSQPYADTEAKLGAFLARFLSLENRASNEKAKKELGWKVQAEKGILDEIATGSYVEVAQSLQKPTA